MSIRSITSCASSLATIVLPSGAMNASSAENRCPLGRLPGPGNDQATRPLSVTTRSRPLPRSAISRPPGKWPKLPGVGDPPLGEAVGWVLATGAAELVGDADIAGRIAAAAPLVPPDDDAEDPAE